jgi:signal transduction histidine kinase/ligand-binding sensor domain-containing protein
MTSSWERPACLFLSGILCVFVCAGSFASPNPDWSLEVWQSDDGLPNNNVAGLAQTPNGYLWLAMPDGLARFDGIRFEEFPTGSFAVNYENQRIRALLETGEGGLCVGVEPGHLIFLNHGAAEIFTNDLPQLTIEGLAQGGDGALWIAYHGGVVCRINNGRVTRFGEAENLPSDGNSCALACDSRGQIWFSKGYETGVFRNGRFNTLMVVSTPASRIAPAHDGGIWMVSGFQLYKFYEGKPLVHCGLIKDGAIRGAATAIMEDSSGAVWIGTSDDGLFRYDGHNFESFPTSDREILSLAEDRERNIWVGTGGGGLDRLRPKAITLENLETGAPFRAVQSLCEGTDGAIWAVTVDGTVVRHSHDDWEVVSNTDIESNMANCVAADPDGSIWIGTREHKILHWQDGRVTILGADNGLESRTIHEMLCSRSGDLWIGGESPDSMQLFRGGKFHDISLPPDAHHLRALTEDTAGNIWAGGDRGVLLKISDGKVIDESALAGNVSKAIRCLYDAGDGSLWVGFSAGGLGRVKDGKFSRIDVTEGLYVGAINQILNDGRGSFWFGSDKGIFRVREKDLEDVADGRAPLLWSIHYGRSEELPSVQAGFGYAPGALKDSSGRLWIPMRTGLAVVQPGKWREDLQPPSVLVNRVTVDDQKVALYGGDMPTGDKVELAKSILPLKLSPKFYRLEFEFTALSFGPPENIHFQYQLEGFDNHWRDAGGSRNAIYSRLPAGSYRFRVKGCNGDGVWNDSGISVAFIVEPFFWQTWWFRLAAIAIFTFMVVAVVRYVSFRRLRSKLQMLEQQAALDRERARIARDIHDDLGGTLTQVALLSGLALRDAKLPEKSGAHLQQISTTTHQVIKSLDEIVWAVNPRNDTLPDLVNYLGQYAVEFLRTAGISCRADLPDHPPSLPVTSEARHNLYLVVKEALNNITRHAGATEVQFVVRITDASINLAIMDNGRGFRNGEAGTFADGVRNMKQRMEEIGGQFHLESAANQGTRLELTFPLQKN